MSDSFRFGDSYRISELCELVSLFIYEIYSLFSSSPSFTLSIFPSLPSPPAPDHHLVPPSLPPNLAAKNARGPICLKSLTGHFAPGTWSIFQIIPLCLRMLAYKRSDLPGNHHRPHKYCPTDIIPGFSVTAGTLIEPLAMLGGNAPMKHI